jgi:hypothetical protein
VFFSCAGPGYTIQFRHVPVQSAVDSAAGLGPGGAGHVPGAGHEPAVEDTTGHPRQVHTHGQARIQASTIHIFLKRPLFYFHHNQLEVYIRLSSQRYVTKDVKVIENVVKILLFVLF